MQTRIGLKWKYGWRSIPVYAKNAQNYGFLVDIYSLACKENGPEMTGKFFNQAVIYTPEKEDFAGLFKKIVQGANEAANGVALKNY